MAKEIQYTANTGMVTINTANSNLDGTGTLGTVLTGASNGTLIKTVTIKAGGNTTPGVVRLFVYEGTNTKLIAEVEVPAITKSSRDPAFEAVLNLDYKLESGGILKASTEVAETFYILAEGLDWAYYASVRPESSRFTANTGMVTVSTANSGLDGSGTLGTIITAASNGTLIQSIVIKAQGNTTPGMIRFFAEAAAGPKIFNEIPIPAVTKSGTAHSFSKRIDFNGKGFALKSGIVLKASTENAESFNIIAEGLNWEYPA